ncbi:MAG: HAD family hydrolase [Acidobacteriota bacterium]|nr:HAD family hydrolase [Acidobacteriota bacterium]
MQPITSKLRFDAVVFDLDGTLADTFSTVLRLFNRVMLERTGRQWRLEEMLPYFGPPETVMFQRMFPAAEVHEPMIADYFRFSHEDGHEIKPFDGISELVSELKSSGVKLGVFSAANAEAARIRVGHAGLLDFFDEVIGGDSVTKSKPHPDGLLHLMERFGVDPAATVYVGDMVADVQTGRSAGVTTVAVTWGADSGNRLSAAKPDHVIDHPRLLRNIIRAD